jgi:hypothetical protein
VQLSQAEQDLVMQALTHFMVVKSDSFRGLQTVCPHLFQGEHPLTPHDFMIPHVRYMMDKIGGKV